MEMDQFISLSSACPAGDDVTISEAADVLVKFCDKHANSFSFCDQGYPLFVKEEFVKVSRGRIALAVDY